MAEYQPGVCNIGRNHRRQRLALGGVSLLASVAFTAWVMVTDQPAYAFAGTFLFASGALLGAIQYYMGFCVSMAALAQYDFEGSGGDAGSVRERTALHADRWRAAQVVALSVAGGGLVAATAFVLDLALVAP
jgi:hypothetical protein